MVVLPTSLAINEVLRLGVKTAAPASYSWIHRTGNGTVTRLTSQTGPTLNFREVLRLNGYYVLTVTTAGVSRNLTFQVLSFATTTGTATGLVAPTITYAPEALVVPQGKAVCFGVVATGSICGYRWWRRDGTVDTELIATGSSPWLTIDKVTFAEEAHYFVEVLHAAVGGASVLSAPVPLDVVPTGE